MTRPHPRIPRTTWWTLALALMVAAPLAGQEAPPAVGDAFGEEIDVELVNVEVWVTDADGKPVEGLEADDFTVRHDGAPVVVSHFSEVRSGTVVAAGTEPPEEDAGTVATSPAAGVTPGHMVLYFDQMRLDPAGYEAVVTGVAGLLADAAVPAERIMILRQDQSLHREAAFGSSAAEIAAALERVAAGAHGGLAAATELQHAKDAILDAWDQAETMSGGAASGLGTASGSLASAGAGTSVGTGPRGAVGGSGGSVMPDTCDLFMPRAQAVVDGWIRDRGARVGLTLAHLRGAAGFLSGLPGVKTLVYVSDGLDVEPGTALGAYVTDFCPTRGRQHELEALADGLSRQFRTLAADLNARRVTLHAVQGSGLRDSGSGSAADRGTAARPGSRVRIESLQRASEKSGMELLAAETGGRAVFDQNDLGDEMAAIARDMDSYYSLAYAPPAGGVGRESRIEVDVAGAGLTARYRRGFRAQDPAVWMSERLAGALHLGITDNPLDVRLGMGKVEAGEPLRLYAMVPVDRLVFVPAADGALARVEVQGSVQAAGDAAPVAIRREFQLRKPPGATADQRVSLPLELDLGPGAHRIAVGLRDLTSGEAAFVTTSFDVQR